MGSEVKRDKRPQGGQDRLAEIWRFQLGCVECELVRLAGVGTATQQRLVADLEVFGSYEQSGGIIV